MGNEALRLCSGAWQPKSAQVLKSTTPVPKGQRKPALLAELAENVPGLRA